MEPMPSFADHKREAIRSYLTRVMHISGNCITRAALIAGVNRTYFYRLLATHGIDPPHKDWSVAMKESNQMRRMGHESRRQQQKRLRREKEAMEGNESWRALASDPDREAS